APLVGASDGPPRNTFLRIVITRPLPTRPSEPLFREDALSTCTNAVGLTSLSGRLGLTVRTKGLHPRENTMSSPFANLPDVHGRFGPYGGRYVPETLMSALAQLSVEYDTARDDADFQREFDHYLKTYVGRPSLLYFAERLTKEAGGARIYLKREAMNHTGAHKINNCIGQALLPKRMGKPRVIAETGAGQHGVAPATAAALFGLTCQVYMGEEDVRRQKLNVFKMKALGATVTPVASGSRTLR